MSDETKFRFRLHVDSTLTVDQIWPDGDAPENPTIEDVVSAGCESLPISISAMCRLVDEWNLGAEGCGEASITDHEYTVDDYYMDRQIASLDSERRDAEARIEELEEEARSFAAQVDALEAAIVRILQMSLNEDCAWAVEDVQQVCREVLNESLQETQQLKPRVAVECAAFCLGWSGIVTSECPICTSTQTHYCPEQWRREIEENGWSKLCPHEVWQAAVEYCSQALDGDDFEAYGARSVERAEYLVGLARQLRGDKEWYGQDLAADHVEELEQHLAAWMARAQAAEARVEELEEVLNESLQETQQLKPRVAELEEKLASAIRGEALAYVETLEERAAQAKARVEELEATIEELTNLPYRANNWVLRSVYESSERERARLEARVRQLEDWLFESEEEATHAIDRAEAALARCAELEGHVDKLARRVVKVALYDPPKGHVAVMLPREDAEWFAESRDVELGLSDVSEACRKALEATHVRNRDASERRLTPDQLKGREVIRLGGRQWVVGSTHEVAGGYWQVQAASSGDRELRLVLQPEDTITVWVE